MVKMAVSETEGDCLNPHPFRVGTGREGEQQKIQAQNSRQDFN